MGQNHLLIGISFCVIGLVCVFSKLGGPIIGSVFSLISFNRAKIIVKTNPALGIIIGLFSLIPIALLILNLFVLGYALFI